MPYTRAQFDKAVAIIGTLPKDGPIQLSNDQKLQFYKFFKQANEGDVKGSRPGVFDFQGKAKWDAWKEAEGVSKEDAASSYVELFLELLKKQDNDDARRYIAEVEAAA